MATLQQTVKEIQAIVRQLKAIRSAPIKPPEKAAAFPFAMCYAASGNFKPQTVGGGGTMIGLHNIVIEVHVARKDLPRDYERAMVYAKLIPNAIHKAHRDGTFTDMETFGQIDYVFGPMVYGDIDTIGFEFTMTEVKTSDVVT